MIADWLVAVGGRLRRGSIDASASSRFVDLAPTDEADSTGVYSAALAEATGNPRVMNIALTGPYGSGKSSVIKSFLKGYGRPVLQISLAAFLPEAVSSAGHVSKQEIERSILQQMLYGADADRLPLSRFKRIQRPGRLAFLASLLMAFGMISFWHLVQERGAIVSGTYFTPFDLTNWFNLATFAVGGACLWLLCHNVYVASFGVSLKSISLKNVEITPRAASEESILNRHLDEIVYFFKTTMYDLVVIEDLDRFENSDIFVTLREINGLINANAGVRRTIRFLYALRDDMFVNTDRTKFFEFIVPVIPIINSSNSIEKVLEQGRRLAIDGRLDLRFLREVSRHLDDLRLIQNIFNEYAVYRANLETGGETDLDANKLLAVLIYKNVFPSDFERLHRGRGNLADVLRGHEGYVAAAESRIVAEISRLEALVEQGERQLPNDLAELRRIYAMALIEMVPEGYTHIGTDAGGFIHLAALARSERLDEFLVAKRLQVQNHHQQRYPQPLPVQPSGTGLGKALERRTRELENGSATFRDATKTRIAELRTELAGLRLSKFAEILRRNSEQLEDLFEPFGEDAELARFLLLEGHLDDTYYQYTSLFHSGRMSPNDNRFLIRIRGYRNPEPGFQIDNADAVIDSMRDEDFSRNYALNVRIVDRLLIDPSTYAMQTERLIRFVASGFSACEDFFAAYYARGAAVPALLTRLASDWEGFVAAILDSPARLSHVAMTLAHLPEPLLENLTRERPALTAFLSDGLADVLTIGVDVAAERLRPIELEVVDLSALDAHPAFVRILFEEGRYHLSIENLEYVYRILLGISDEAAPRERNYTLALGTGSAPLLRAIEDRFGEYLDNVLLRLPENRGESVEAMLDVIGRTGLSQDAVIRFLQRQTALLPSLDVVPPHLRSSVFEIGCIEPTWGNCRFFLEQEEFDADVLTSFLDRPSTIAALAQEPLSDGAAGAGLRTFVVANDALSDAAYAAYVGMLPVRLERFPNDIGPGKLEILIDRNRVEFSPDALSQLSSDAAMAVSFVRNNLTDFFDVEDDCGLDDDFRERLLRAGIGDEAKLRVLRAMDLDLLDGSTARATIVGALLLRTRATIDGLEADGAQAVILAGSPLEVQIELLNMLQDRFDDDRLRELLPRLSRPLSDIGPGYAIPRLPATDANRTLVNWLKARGIISSWAEGGLLDSSLRIYNFRS